jgi:hypothetical protein
MATTEQLARQLQRELDARSEAIKRLRERTRTAEDRCYASSTVYGSAFISKGLELITEQISNQLYVINLGRASDKADAILSIQSCEPCVLALITAKGVLDILGMRRIEDLTYKAATTHIGNLVYHQMMLDQFCNENADLFNKTRHSHSRSQRLFVQGSTVSCGYEALRNHTFEVEQHRKTLGWCLVSRSTCSCHRMDHHQDRLQGQERQA